MYLPKYLLAVIVLFIASCAPTNQQKTAGLVDLVKPGETVAVTAIYDETSGAVTALGNRWRDEIEAALSRQHIIVKARRDLGFIIDDNDSFGSKVDEQKIWQTAGADLIINGSYRLQPNVASPHALLTLKLLDTKTANVRQTLNLTKKLTPGWAKSAAQVSGNVFQESVEILVDSSNSKKKPPLSARLNRQPACFPTAAAGIVLVQTEPGTHVYLLNLAADQSVTLLHPNSRLPDQKLISGHFEFPPPALSKEIQLVFYPLIDGQMSHESIKVISSYFPIDFSYLPVPENAIYAGVKGGDIKQVLKSLKQAQGWSEQVLDYWVGPECQ